jgi:hypothetical protein
VKTTDLQPLMVFDVVSDLTCQPDFVIDEIKDGRAIGRWVSVVAGQKVDTLDLEELVDSSKFTFNPLLTLGAMHARISSKETTMEKGREKFERFDAMLAEVRTANGSGAVCFAHPGILGDTYEEIVENLNRLADAGVAIRIAPRASRPS